MERVRTTQLLTLPQTARKPARERSTSPLPQAGHESLRMPVMQPSWPQTSSFVPQGNIVCCAAETAMTVMSLMLYGPAPLHPMLLPARESAYGVALPLTEPGTKGSGVRVGVGVAVGKATSACTGKGV